MLQLVKGPYLRMPSENSITIMWETSENSTSEVSIANTKKIHTGLNGNYITDGKPIHVINKHEYERIHHVTVDGLKPGTNYHYKVVSRYLNSEFDEEITSPEDDKYYNFKTAVDKQTPFSFAVTSETGGFGDDEINFKIFKQLKNIGRILFFFPGT